MIKTQEFKEWLKSNSTYTDAVICDMASRAKRADSILEWNEEETYLFYLERQPEYQALSTSVRSQIKRAVKSYTDFMGSASK